MNWITNEYIFYSGLVMVALAVVAAVILVPFFIIKTIKLSAKFDEEYGKAPASAHS